MSDKSDSPSSASDSSSKSRRAARSSPTLPLSREEVLSRGEAALRQLVDPVFNVAVRDAVQSWQDAILTSSPEETALREQMYYRMRALNDVLAELPGYLNAARSMTQEEIDEEMASASAWASTLSHPLQ